MGSASTFEQASAEFRQHLPNLTTPRFTIAKQQDAHTYADAFQKNHQPPWLYDLTRTWQKLYEQPYTGITTDGTVRKDLFDIQDESVPVGRIVARTNTLLDQLSPEQRSKVSYPIHAREWRAWSNPEFLLRNFGLRLEDVSDQIAQGILSVVEATFSRKGYEKALAAMRINHFLGEICEIPKIMNKYSYNFLLFGKPSATEPWGWLLYGHHLCLSVFLKGPQIIISPTFTGAEPNVIDVGEFAGTAILHQEGELGFALMQSLDPATQTRAQIYKLLHDPAMKQTGDLATDRWNKDDQRHVCGAFRDNRIVPHEGVCVADFNPQQEQLVLDVAEQFLLYLPDVAREMRKEKIKSYFKETFFCWIGGYGPGDAFYYRLQSPVVIFEFDHHSGVFLTNPEPAKFHTHTIVRTPNAGDYGWAMRRPEERF